MSSNQRLKILQKSSFLLLLFLVGCSQISGTVKDIEKIDQEYGVELSQYENGLTFFEKFLRDDPLNQPDYDEYCKKIQAVAAKNEKSKQYIDFRYNICMAEKNYRLAYFMPKSNFDDDSILCRYEQGTVESIDAAKEAVTFMNKALELYPSIKGGVDLSDNWEQVIAADNEAILLKADSKERLINKFC